MSIPGYWMHETTGVLRPAVEAYLAASINPHAPEMTEEQIAAVRAYPRQWMNGPWLGPLIDVLRSQVDEVTTREEIDRWLDRALDAGIDPL